MIASDFRYAARALRRSRGFSASVVGLLALGIGACTIAFSLFHALFLQSLPVAHPEALVRIVQRLPRVGPISSFPETYYAALRDRARTIAFTVGQAGEFYHFAATDSTPSEDIAVRGVTPEFFEAMGVQARYGRTLDADDHRRVSDTPAAVLSYRFWRRHFGGDATLVGHGTVGINGHRFMIVGVMAEAFHGVNVDTSPDVWIPLVAYTPLAPGGVKNVRLELVARMISGVAIGTGEAEARSIWQAVMPEYYKDTEPRSENDSRELVARGVEFESLKRGLSLLRASVDNVLELSLAATLALLLIVCLNVGGILLVRAVARRQEFTIQLALGAPPAALVRQVVAEAMLVTIAGGVGGLFLASTLLPFASQTLPPIRDRGGSLLPLALNVTINWPVAALVLAVATISVLLFTVSPALVVSRCPVGLQPTRVVSRSRTRHLVAVLQIAACTLLLLIAALFTRTVRELRHVAPGFEPAHVATFTGDAGSRVGADATAFLDTLQERVRELPGVVAASVASVGAMRGRGVAWTIAPTGERITSAHFLDTGGNTVSADYFRTLGMRIVRGSGLPSDQRALMSRGTPTVVNETFASRFFPNVEPIGKHFGLSMNGIAGSQFEIVGVVNDAKVRSLRDVPSPMFYTLGTPFGTYVLYVRTSADPASVIEPVRRTLADLDPTLPFREVHTMREEIEQSIAPERLAAALATGAAGCAAVFVAAGLYGLLAFVAAQRRREIAVCMALGANAADIARLVAQRIVLFALVGIVIGLIAAMLGASVLQASLFNISPRDTDSIVGTVVLILLVTAAATAGPIIRAIRTDPARGLRHE